MQRLMRRRRLATLWCPSIGGFALWLLLLSSQCYSEQVSVDSTKGSGDLLKLCADLHHANLSKIETWTGRASVVNRTYEDGILVRATENDAEFWCRPNSGEFASKWQVVKREEKSERTEYPATRVTVVSPDRFIETTRYQGPDDTHYTFIHPLKDLRAKSGSLAQLIDPMFFFRSEGSEALSEELLHIKSDMEKFGVGWRVSRAGDTVTVSYGDDVGYNEYTIDLSQGGVLKHYNGQGFGLVETRSTHYDLIDGVFLPVRWEFRNAKYVDSGNRFDYDGAPQHVSERTVVLRESRLNEPIDDAIFSIANAGIRKGEWVGDLINGGGFYFESDDEEDETVQRSSIRWYFIFANAILFVVVVGCILWKRRYSNA